MNPQQNPNRVMTIKEVSAFLKIPVSTLYVLVKKGTLKGAKFGRQWRFLEQDILDCLRGGVTRAA